MNVIIIGAGELGQLLADRLCASQNDVVMIDTDGTEFDRVRDRLDVMTLVGDATDVAVLKRAGIATADLLLAVSGDPAVNMLSCQLARHFGVRRTVCRLYSLDGFSEEDGITPEFFGIGRCFSSPAECTRHVAEILRFPSVLEQIEFSNPDATVVTVRILPESPLRGTRLQELPNTPVFGRVRFAAMVRQRQLKFPHGDTVFETDDRVYVAGNRADVEAFLAYADPEGTITGRTVVLSGTGELAEQIAREALKIGCSVSVLEPDARKAEHFLNRMPEGVRVLCGASTDTDVLREADIASSACFVTLEDDDENNILSCIIAKRLGAPKVAAVTHKSEYHRIVQEMDVIDSDFNSTVVSANAVFRLMNEGIVRVDSHLECFDASLTEFRVQPSSRLVGKMVKDARLPKSVVLAMIFRDGAVLAPAGRTELQAGDVVVAIVTPTSEEQLKPYFLS